MATVISILDNFTLTYLQTEHKYKFMAQMHCNTHAQMMFSCCLMPRSIKSRPALLTMGQCRYSIDTIVFVKSIYCCKKLTSLWTVMMIAFNNVPQSFIPEIIVFYKIIDATKRRMVLISIKAETRASVSITTYGMK